MKTVRIRCTWKATITAEVPDDFEGSSNLNEWPDEVVDQIDSSTAELVDWEVAG